MKLLDNLQLAKLTPSRLWAALDPETRRLAAGCLYRPDWDGAGARVEADLAIASALRFRQSAVRRLPLDKRVEYLTRAVRPDESLAGSLLRALHLCERSAMLATFLDRLGIPQRDGVIDIDDEIDPPDEPALRAATAALRERYPAAEIDLYLASLLALDPVFWRELASVIEPGS